MEDGHEGCWRAHRGIAVDALERGLAVATVFESDVHFHTEFLDDPSFYLTAAERGLAAMSKDWDIFFLAQNAEAMQLLGAAHPAHCRPQRPHSCTRVVAVRAWGGAAYVIQRQMMHTVASSQYGHLLGGTIDGLFRFAKALAIHPNVAYHPDNWSSTEQRRRNLRWRKHAAALFSQARVGVGGPSFGHETSKCERCLVVPM